MQFVALVVAAIVGAVLWTLTEYAMHRFSFHHRGSGRINRLVATEHTRHHREPSRTNLAMRLAGHALVATLGLPFGVAIAAVTSRQFGATVWIVWALGYVVYEVGHWRLHHRAPRTARGLARRLHHMTHHGADAASNFGVTLDVWDRVFDTDRHDDIVTLHEDLAPEWLLSDRDSYPSLAVRGSQQTPS